MRGNFKCQMQILVAAVAHYNQKKLSKYVEDHVTRLKWVWITCVLIYSFKINVNHNHDNSTSYWRNRVHFFIHCIYYFCVINACIEHFCCFAFVKLKYPSNVSRTLCQAVPTAVDIAAKNWNSPWLPVIYATPSVIRTVLDFPKTGMTPLKHVIYLSVS